MSSKERQLRNLIGCTQHDRNFENLGCILAEYFEDHVDCPECDEDDRDDSGWNPWAIERSDELLIAVARKIIGLNPDIKV